MTIISSSNKSFPIFILLLALNLLSFKGTAQVTAYFEYEQQCDYIEFTNYSSASGGATITGYLWDFGDFTTSTDENPTHTYDSQGSYLVQLTVNFDGAEGQKFYSDYVYFWFPNATFTAPANCLGEPTVFNSTSTTNATTNIVADSLLWDFNNDGIYDASGLSVNYIFPSPGMKTVKLRAKNNVGCSDIETKNIEIFELPEAGFEADTVCLGIATAFTDTSLTPAGTSIVLWSWDFNNDGVEDAATANPFWIFPSSGVFPVTLIVTNDQGCSSQATGNVFVAGFPTASFSFSPGCPGLESHFNDQSTGNGSTIDFWEWDFDDGSPLSNLQNPNHIFNINGVYNIKLMVQNEYGCADDTIRNMLVEKPSAGFSFVSGCFGDETSFTDTSSVNVLMVASWQWDFGDGSGTSTEPNPVYIYGNEGVYDVELIVANLMGCKDTIVHSVLVDTIPVAVFSHGTSCAGTQTCFTDQSTPNAEGITTWQWNFGDGNISMLQNPCHIYSDTGSYQVSLVVMNSDGCSSLPYSQNIYVAYSPQANFDATVNCYGDTTQFVNLTDSLGTNIFSWQWDFDDTASGTYNNSALFEPSHLFSTEGSFNVSLSVENIYGCSDMYQAVVNVDSIPQALFTMPDTTGMTVQFYLTDASIEHGSPIITRFWDFGDGTTATNINPVFHTYSDPGKYTVCLSIDDFNGCQDMFCDTIVVLGEPTADFIYASDVTLETYFYDESDPDNNIVNWFWDFGDPTTTSDTISGVSQPVYQYPDEGWYTVYLKAFDKFGGSHDTSKMIYSGNAVKANFAFAGGCLGETTLFRDNSYSPISAGFESWYWDFDDGSDTTYHSMSDSIYHKFQYPGIYKVRFALAATVNGFFMSDTVEKTVRIAEQPVIMIDTTGLGVCYGTPIDFNDISSYVNFDPPEGWIWDFRDGDTSALQNPTHTYADTGSYWVTLQVVTQNGCGGIDSIRANVNFSPEFSFNVENACVNSPAQFVPVYDSSKITITSWHWNFGDIVDSMNTSSEAMPTHVYDRIDLFTTTMKMSSYGCPGESEKTFLVYPIPYSDFSVTPDFENIQGRTRFENNSIYSNNYLWDFGNGNTSTVDNPVEVYEYDSIYNITLISYNEYGCSDTSRYNLNVFFKGLYLPTAFSPNNPNQQISIFKPKGVNLKEFQVQVFDMRGNLMWESDKLDENGTPMESWDGYYDGVLQPEGMYVWKAYGLFRDGSVWKGQSFEKGINPQTTGIVTLIR